MKKFWIVLLALGLVAGFAMSASAADVKFSGSYYVTGMYIDNPGLTKDSYKTVPAQSFYWQRLRVQTEFKVAEGLSLVTRFDALEKAWGYGIAGNAAASATSNGTSAQTGWRYSNAYDVTNRSSIGYSANAYPSSLNAREQENLEWERAYIDFNTKIGKFQVGYQNFIAWGTMFLDTHVTIPGIKYIVPVGPLTIVAAIEKRVDQNAGIGTTTDADGNVYDLGAIYKFGAGEAGMMYQYSDNRVNRNQPYAAPIVVASTTAPGFTVNTADLAGGSQSKMHFINPYVKMKFGPVYVEAEGLYGFGDFVKYDVLPAGAKDITGSGYALYVNAKADIGPAYVGGQFVWMSGDDPSTSDKREGTMAAALLAGQAYDPCLILWNDGQYGANHRVSTSAWGGVFIDNVWFYQIYGGFKPVKEADIMVSLSYAYADKKPWRVTGVASTEYKSDVYGTELDVVAKYKIFDNLEYMIGFGYLWTGNYFKADEASAALSTIDNNYMLFHRLTLTF